MVLLAFAINGPGHENYAMSLFACFYQVPNGVCTVTYFLIPSVGFPLKSKVLFVAAECLLKEVSELSRKFSANISPMNEHFFRNYFYVSGCILLHSSNHCLSLCT